MKAKLTLTVEAELIPRAKRAARRRGTSLSALVEEALRHADRSDAPSFSARWRGRLRPAHRTTGRYRALAAKYL